MPFLSFEGRSRVSRLPQRPAMSLCCAEATSVKRVNRANDGPGREVHEMSGHTRVRCVVRSLGFALSPLGALWGEAPEHTLNLPQGRLDQTAVRGARARRVDSSMLA